MKKTRLIAMLLTLAMAGSLLAGCGDKNNADNESNNQGESNTPEYLVWNIGAEPKTWDPTLSSETLSEYLTISMFEGLTRQVEDGIEPGVAETWDISDDGLTYTFHLRESNWSDGTPVTAHDFEYTWKRMCDPKVASPSAAGVTDYVVGDPLKELYSNCGLFVLPSHTEGLSLSLLEALSIGARCLVSDIPENTVVTDIYGAAFKPEDTDDLARALERECTQEYPDAMRQQQIEYVHTNFEYDVMLDRYEEVYHHVVGDPLKAMPSTLKKGRVPAGAKA